jgi:hypothetical protein
MTYPYCKKNILENPERYMYTEFKYEIFFRDFFLNRKIIINDCYDYKNAPTDLNDNCINNAVRELSIFIKNNYQENFLVDRKILDFLNDYKYLPYKNNFTKSSINFNYQLNTKFLLENVISSYFSNNNIEISNIILNKIIQRFEVTKKIHQEYDPDIKKGIGDNKNLELYWIFAIAICLSYIKKNNLKYLNTLLKLCDLIASQNSTFINSKISKIGVLTLFIFETQTINHLLLTKGINFAP